jgi:CheY-like chemotaxis protein
VRDPAIDGLKLLVVEDEYLLALYLADMLGDMGAEVLGPVACVADALELIEATPEIDAAILDVNLAGEAVFPVADRLNARRVPFAFASGYDPDLMPARFRDVGVCQKPIDADAVRGAIARLRRAA